LATSDPSKKIITVVIAAGLTVLIRLIHGMVLRVGHGGKPMATSMSVLGYVQTVGFLLLLLLLLLLNKKLE
jgi:hypothetical protein